MDGFIGYTIGMALAAGGVGAILMIIFKLTKVRAGLTYGIPAVVSILLVIISSQNMITTIVSAIFLGGVFFSQYRRSVARANAPNTGTV